MSQQSKPNRDVLLAFVFGVAFVVVVIVLAVWIRNPPPFTEFVFRVVLALAAAGLGAVIPGLIQVNVGTVIRASGALALFVLVFWFNPPSLTQREGLPPVWTIDIPREMSLQQVLAVVEQSYRTTVVVRCEAAAQTRVRKGRVTGESLRLLLTNLAHMTIPPLNYEIRDLQGVGHELVCE